jgi:hypothetical protein
VLASLKTLLETGLPCQPHKQRFPRATDMRTARRPSSGVLWLGNFGPRGGSVFELGRVGGPPSSVLRRSNAEIEVEVFQRTARE